MESYGELLRNARESKNLDIERIAREISIDARYLTALENEESGYFPGEAYLTGFLKNYSAYLELDSDFILKLYHNKLIQESPVPEGLFVKHRSPVSVLSIVIPIVLIVGVIVVVSVLLLTKKSNIDPENVLLSGNGKTETYELTERKFERRVYKGDQFVVSTATGQIILTVCDTLGSFALETPAGVFYTDLSEENELDINGDSISDLIVYVYDVSYTDAARGAEVSILMRQGTYVDRTTSVPDEEIPLASDVKSRHPQRVIHEDNRAYPFTINASFRGNCLFRDKVDNSDAVETYFSKGELFTATPHNGIRLWLSNSNTVKLTIIADSRQYDLDIGAAGKVLVEDIKWIKDTDGRYKLVVIELD